MYQERIASLRLEDAFESAKNFECAPRSAFGERPARHIEQIKSLLRQRKSRRSYVRDDLLGDHVWGMLLELALSDLLGSRMSVTNLGLAADVPATTALRWIEVLVRIGYVTRVPDPLDGRRVYLTLEPEGLQRMEGYLDHLGRIGQ